MTQGIYKITGPNDSVYIGSAVNIENRWSVHKNALKNNKHHSKYLQNIWNKYGKDVFTFSILEVVEDKTVLIDIEQKHLDFIFTVLPKSRIYNTTKYAYSTLGIHLSSSTKAKIALSKIGNKNSLGKMHSQETKDRISQTKKGRIATAETKLKMSIAQKGNKSHTGRIFSDIHKANLSKAKLGNTNNTGKRRKPK